MTRERDEVEQAVQALREEIYRLLLPVMRWIDRQLRRWPWFYRRLGGE